MASDLQNKWEERIRRAKKVRDEWATQFKVQLGRDYFEGKQNPGWPESEWITINQIYAHMKAQLPSLYAVDPYFYVKLKKSFNLDDDPKKAAAEIMLMEEKGKTRQSMLNYLKGELKLKNKARMGIQDAHFAYGVLKVRRASDFEKHPKAGEEIVDEDGKPVLDPDTGEPQVYPEELPINERYEWCRVHPDDILFDEDSGPLEDSWGWIAQRIRMTKEDALEDRRFKKSIVQKISGKAREEKKEETRSGISLGNMFKKKTPEDEFIDTWEIYDLKKREWLTIAEDADDVLVKPKGFPPGVEKHPFSFLRFTLRDSSPYPIPPVYPAMDPQKELNLTRSMMLTHRKRFNRKYEVDINKMEDPDVELPKLEAGDDGTLIRVMALGAVNPIKDAPLDQQYLLETRQLENDITQAFGSPQTSLGVAASESATEASILDRRLDIREGDALSEVVDWITDSAGKMDKTVQAHIDETEAVKITGVQGEFWRLVRQQDYEQINGEFEYSVNTGASQARLPEIERSQWIAFMSQVVIPFPHILTEPAIMKRMAEMFHIEDEAAIEAFRQLGLKIMQGVMPMPGGQGGGPSDNPVAQIMGAAMGPSGGNANGGGAPAEMQQ